MTPQIKQELTMPVFCKGIAGALPMAAAVVDGPDHIVRCVNPAFCGLVGKSQEELIGTPFAALVPVDLECLALLERVYRTGESETHTGQESSVSNSFCWSYTIWPILGAEGIVVLVTENTPSHEKAVSMNQALLLGSVRQHELRAMAEDLNTRLKVEIAARQRAQAELQRANEELEHFAYAVSHDLQEPLRTIGAYAELLAVKLSDHLNSETSEFVSYIVEGSSRMSALIQDLLAYARAGAAEQPETMTSIRCEGSLLQALSNLQVAVNATHAVITSDPLPSVHADRRQLTQVWQNLIGNALKYSNPDGPPHIHVGAELHEDEWILSVRDDGIGFDPRFAEQIFTVFKRLHKARYPGTGVGLALCKRIVERHHGRIWAVGEVNKGATFFFTMPRSADEVATLPANDKHLSTRA